MKRHLLLNVLTITCIFLSILQRLSIWLNQFYKNRYKEFSREKLISKILRYFFKSKKTLFLQLISIWENTTTQTSKNSSSNLRRKLTWKPHQKKITHLSLFTEKESLRKCLTMIKSRIKNFAMSLNNWSSTKRRKSMLSSLMDSSWDSIRL